MAKAPFPAATAGLIEPHVLYHLEEAKRRLGWRDHATRTARRNGLPVRYAGRRACVLGQHIIDYIEKHGATTN